LCTTVFIIKTATFHEIRMVHLMVTLIVVPISKKEFTECVFNNL